MNGKRSVHTSVWEYDWPITSRRIARWRHCRRLLVKIDAKQEEDAEEAPFPHEYDDHDDCGGGMTPMDWFYEWKASQAVL